MDIPPWWTAVASGLVPAGVGIWTVIKWWGERAERKLEKQTAVEVQQENVLNKERDALTARYDMLMKDLRSDLDRCRSLVDATDADRHQAWDRARFWHRQAWEMWHKAAGARQVAESIARLSKQDPPKWPDSLQLPMFDGGAPDWMGSSNEVKGER